MTDLARLRSGDHEYFRSLIRDHGSLVMGMARAYADSPDQAEDLFQKVWIQVYEKRTSFRGEGAFTAWLGRLVHNLCRNEVRRGKTELRVLNEATGKGVAEGLAWTAPDPETSVEDSERYHDLMRALDNLTPREKEAVHLKILEDLPEGIVAKIMGIRNATVRSTVRNAIRHLRETLKEPDE